jgi:hypothetical protein
VLKFLSVNNIVIAPANTGNDISSNIAVINVAHTNNGILCIVIPGARMFIIVVIKFIAPSIDAIPAKCKLNIAKSTLPPLWYSIDDNGGYTTHDVPAPRSTNADDINSVNEGGINQKLMLFIRGKLISGAPIISGTNMFPKAPISTGITKKNIIINPCAVIITLYKCASPANTVLPGWLNSIRIITENAVPIRADNNPNTKYNIPMFL